MNLTESNKHSHLVLLSLSFLHPHSHSLAISTDSAECCRWRSRRPSCASDVPTTGCPELSRWQCHPPTGAGPRLLRTNLSRTLAEVWAARRKRWKSALWDGRWPFLGLDCMDLRVTYGFKFSWRFGFVAFCQCHFIGQNVVRNTLHFLLVAAKIEGMFFNQWRKCSRSARII